MEPSEAFNLTLNLFQIKAVDIARASNQDEATVSRFRNGVQDVNSKTLVVLIRAMPLVGQMTFWAMCMSSELDFEILRKLKKKHSSNEKNKNSTAGLLINN